MPILSHHSKAALAGAWILAAGLIGVMGNVISMGAGTLLLGFGLLPPLIIILRGNAEARRHRTGQLTAEWTGRRWCANEHDFGPSWRYIQGMKCLRPAGLALALLVYASAAGAQTTAAADPPDFRVQIWGTIAADFNARIEEYLNLRRTLEQGLPPLIVTDDPAEILRAELALAKRIQAARAGARQGDIFTREIRADFRRVLRLETDQPTRAAIMDENPGAFSSRINRIYPKEHSVSTVPANILAALPRLPDDIQYRFLGPNLVLHDIRANIILDRLPCAIRCD